MNFWNAPSALAAPPLAMPIYCVKYLRPQLLRDTFSGGINVTRRAENERRMQDALKFYVIDPTRAPISLWPTQRAIYAAPHAVRHLLANVPDARGSKVHGLVLGDFTRARESRYPRMGMRKKTRLERRSRGGR